MPDESPRTWIMHAAERAARWRARSNRQIWLVVLALVIVMCAEAVVIPASRHVIPGLVIGLIGTGWLATESRRSRGKREALGARLATLTPDDMPADVISLVAAGKKIQAIKRYRDLTGVGLKEAKTTIDSL
jgi:ribosomal protein L7/L12